MPPARPRTKASKKRLVRIKNERRLKKKLGPVVAVRK
jgi:hypothetical protein